MQSIHNILCEKLNPRSGVIKISISNDEDRIYFDISWKRDFHFIVTGCVHYGWYYVQRDKQRISLSYVYQEIDDRALSVMQHIIDEIENGKYNNKKTEKEKIKQVLEERNLTSFMNNTKWKELIDSIMENMRDIPIQYKTIFDEEEPSVYWTIDTDEHFFHMNMSVVEWFKIRSKFEKVIGQGRLIEPKICITDKKPEIECMLNRFSIPYEYDDIEKCFIIFGYR